MTTELPTRAMVTPKGKATALSQATRAPGHSAGRSPARAKGSAEISRSSRLHPRVEGRSATKSSMAPTAYSMEAPIDAGMAKPIEQRLAQEVSRELAFGRALVLLARRQVLELDGDIPTLIVPLHLLSHGWERLLKTTLLLARTHRDEGLDSGWARHFGHDVHALSRAFIEECCEPADTPELQLARKVWGSEGSWLMDSISAYATGSRYFGLDLMTQMVTDPDSVPPEPVNPDEAGPHPEDQWLDFYIWQQINHGLATEAEIDEMDSRPAYGRINVRIASLIEDQLQGLVSVYESGRLGERGRGGARHLRFARWTCVDF